jgi:hypothetical protein
MVADQLASMQYGRFRGVPPTTVQVERLWRINDGKSFKAGDRRTLYWVKRNAPDPEGGEHKPFSRGTSYQGEWKDNKKEGYGIQQYATGDKYEGQWCQGRRHGEGVLWSPSGKNIMRKVYTGGWVNDKKHGEGTCFYVEGESYQGSWANGRRHGQGTMRYASGDVYIGQWDADQRCGTGTLSRANGDCYEGTWLHDKREGTGSYFYSSGKVLVAEWENDVARTGVYTQSQAPPTQHAAPVTTVLPPVRLEDGAAVLEAALSRIRTARTAFRAKSTPIDQLFTREELAELHDAFEAAHVNGKITLLDLKGLYLSLGVEIEDDQLIDLLAKVDFSPETLEELRSAEKNTVPLSFTHFARTIALVLDQELADAQLLEEA